MNDLVFIQNDQPVTTSLKVAEYFGKQHKNVIRDIEKIIADCTSIEGCSNLSIPSKFLKSSYVNSQNNMEYPMYLMNYDGFTLLTMGFTGKKALKFKLDYIAAFNAMKDKLIQILAERKSAEWQQVRKSTKIDFRNLTDVIKEKLIPLMKAEGISDKSVKWVYKNYVSMIQKLLGIKNGTRDELPLDLLYELNKCQQMARVIIKGLVAGGARSSQIYSGTKQRIESYAQLSFFNQRFLGEH